MLRTMDDTQHDEVVLAPQRGKPTFLDLPGELRNTIYKMVSQAAVACKGKLLCRGKHRILNRPDEKVAIPAIASTNRQIRTEFLSQQLPNYLVVIHSEDPTHYWNTRLDEIFKRYLSNLLLTRPDIFPRWIPNQSSTSGQSAELLYKEFARKHRVERVRLRAEHTDDASPPARTQFLFTFFFIGPQVPMLTEETDSAIRRILTDIYSGNRSNSCADLIQAVDRLQKLQLSICVDWLRTEPRFRCIECRYLILDSPRRLRVATSCTSDFPFRYAYRPLDEGDGVFHHDELL